MTSNHKRQLEYGADEIEDSMSDEERVHRLSEAVVFDKHEDERRVGRQAGEEQQNEHNADYLPRRAFHRRVVVFHPSDAAYLVEISANVRGANLDHVVHYVFLSVATQLTK